MISLKFNLLFFTCKFSFLNENAKNNISHKQVLKSLLKSNIKKSASKEADLYNLKKLILAIGHR
ncbi:hypothetical protein BC749_107269 [Flavobacterium araucananum]|uniref:Uncharacterized protein n=1 Tax=Flavobacterium araucananum TaxID=946678 RepID=A0A227PD07_9FLAO|nr:hypothetical protein B0A64_09515 [Flavobacterium araucananum]PWJ97467.1 hypothetical protein BC749_107269 [Flavobacterium araucananum]